MKQTSVDFLYEFVLMKLTNDQQAKFEGLFHQAKQMEKEQMKMMYIEGAFAQLRYLDSKELVNAETYYNKTFKSE